MSGQKLIVFAFDSTTNLPKTGDAANLTAYVSKDYGSVTVLGDTSATEMDSTNAKGYYLFDLTQGETNADTLLFSAKSSTANIVVIGVPGTVFTTPPNFNKAIIDSAGLQDANVVKVGPSGSGTAQTAKDLGASATQTGDAYAVVNDLTFGNAKLVRSTTPANTLSVDSSHRVPATVASGDDADAATILGRVTAARAGYWDNLNVGGPVASHADIAAINQSASKHVLLQTVGQYERPESGNVTYTVEARTFSAADGSAVNADTTPTLTATGNVSGSLAANLSAATNPATGVYRWTYTVSSSATVEQVRFDISAAISSATFTLSCYTQVCDLVSATWTTTDATHLTTIFNKLPANNIADQTLLPAAVRDVSLASPAAGGLGDVVKMINTNTALILGDVSPAVANILSQTDQLQFNVSGYLLSAPQLGTPTDTLIYTRQGVPVGASQSADVAALKADLDAGVTLANNAVDAAQLTAAAANKLADHARRRTQAHVFASADGDAIDAHSHYGAIQQIQKANTTAHAGKLTVFNTDGTELAQLTLASDPAADPATGVS